MNLREWDERHRSEAQDAAVDPYPLVKATVSGLRPGRALDLACGTGRNALWLAEQGWEVAAVDGSPAAIEVLRARIETAETQAMRHFAIEARVADLERHEFAIEPDSWDLILMCLYLQRDLFEAVKRGVAPGGLVIAVALLAEPGKSRYRVEPGELRGYFEGWTILHDREDPAGPHPLAEIAARRP